MQYIFTLDKEQVRMILSALRLKVETWYTEADVEYSAAQRQIDLDIMRNYQQLHQLLDKQQELQAASCVNKQNGCLTEVTDMEPSFAYIDRYGNCRCGRCCEPLFCDENGDMPVTCPRCDSELDYGNLDQTSLM